MIDAQGHRASKNAGGLVVLSLAWVAVLGLAPQSSGPQTSNDLVGPPAPNDIWVECTSVRDINTDMTYDASIKPGVLGGLQRAFSEAGQNIVLSKSTRVDTSNAVWNYDDLGRFYSAYKTNSTYRILAPFGAWAGHRGCSNGSAGNDPRGESSGQRWCFLPAAFDNDLRQYRCVGVHGP